MLNILNKYLDFYVLVADPQIGVLQIQKHFRLLFGPVSRDIFFFIVNQLFKARGLDSEILCLSALVR